MLVVALREFNYAGKRYIPGDEFDAKIKHARVLIYSRRVRALKRDKADIPPPPDHIAAIFGPNAEAERNNLRVEARRVGVSVDGRWGISRLREEMVRATEWGATP